MREFFVSTNLGFEAMLLEELKAISPRVMGLDGRPSVHEIQFLGAEKGGVRLLAPLEVGLQFNYFSKLANRVLLRLLRARVRDFPKLFQLASNLKLQEFLPEKKISFSVSAGQSRLNNEKRITEVLGEALTANSWRIQDGGEQTLFVRIFQDDLEISLDSSGEHLHFRGYRSHQGAAPLRETVAAACVTKMLEGEVLPALEPLQWLDLMCGSGTFLLEIDQHFAPNTHRDFAFEAWGNCPKLMRDKSLLKNHRGDLKLEWKLFGADRDQEVLKLAEKNFAQIQRSVTLQKRDFFELKAEDLPAGRRWLILNPPWGERLSAAQLDFGKLVDHAFDHLAVERIGMLVPSSVARNLTRHPKRQETSLAFKSGGLEVEFLQFRQNKPRVSSQ